MSDIDERWPYDGPHTPHAVVSAAQATSTLVRYMANALWTVRPTGPQVHEVLSSLDTAMYRMGHVLEHLRSHATELADDETLVDDRDGIQAGDTVETLAAWLDQAHVALVGAQRPIQRAAQTASHLGHQAVNDEQP